MFCVPSHAASGPRKLAPPIPCKLANRMDFFIDEDNIMWECSCEVLAKHYACRWQVVAGVEAVKIKKRLRLHYGALPKLVIL